MRYCLIAIVDKLSVASSLLGVSNGGVALLIVILVAQTRVTTPSPEAQMTTPESTAHLC